MRAGNRKLLTRLIWLGLSIIASGLAGCGQMNLSPTETVPVNPPLTPTAVSTPTPTPVPLQRSTIVTESNLIDGAVLSYVPEGAFEMGAETAEGAALCQQERDGCQPDWFENEGPVHTVYLDAFWIYQMEVRNSMYAQCVGAGGCQEPIHTDYFDNPDYTDHPVVYVEWGDAVDYCQWAGGRLPTEAEWEKAARGGLEQMPYPWGDEYPSCTAGAPNGAHYDACGDRTVPVGSFSPNEYDLYDMVGNAWEWVWDWYAEDYYSLSPRENPVGPESGEAHVIRGGSFYVTGWGLRSASRFWDHPLRGVGFRCVIPELP